MKKLILITLLASCTETTEAPFIITSIKLGNFGPKYKIVLNNRCSLYTDSLYSVGDTLK